jgi:hypothetical protein
MLKLPDFDFYFFPEIAILDNRSCRVVFFNFVMLPHEQSSTRRFSHIWLYTSYERNFFIKILLCPVYEFRNKCVETMCRISV